MALPGSGKGTQAKKLVELYQLQHISTGDLLRSEIADGTTLGKEAQEFMKQGLLVPDEVVIGMIRNKLDQQAGKVRGFIFDGFPRTVAQALALDDLLQECGTSIAGVLALQVSDEEIVKRILERGKTSGRADDNDESTIRKRIDVYNKETAQVAGHY